MSEDLIVNLATEKIRQDFGDLSATVYQILLIQNGCSIYEINKIFPETSR